MLPKGHLHLEISPETHHLSQIFEKRQYVRSYTSRCIDTRLLGLPSNLHLRSGLLRALLIDDPG